MKTLKHIFSFLKNKYVLTIVGVAVWLLFFDRNNVFSQYERNEEVKKVEAEHSYYKTEIANNKREGIELQSNLKLLEKFGREHYLMKKDNEEIYLLVEDSLERK